MPKRIPWHRTVGSRLGLAGALVLFVCAGLMAASLLGVRSLHDRMAFVNEVGKMRRSSYQLLYLSSRLSDDDAPRRGRTTLALRQAASATGESLHAVSERSDSPLLASMARRWDGRIGPALRSMGERASSPTEEELAQLDTLLREQASDADSAVTQAMDEGHELVEASEQVQWLLLVMVVGVLAFAFQVTRGIGARTKSLASAAERVAGGELVLAAPVEGADEIGALGESINTMTESLRRKIESETAARRRRDELLEAVRDTVRSLEALSQRIVEGTVHQAASTRQQAAAVTETAATMQQVSQTAEETTARAEETLEAANLAEQTGATGRSAAADAVESMHHVRRRMADISEGVRRLADSARAIDDIIATVDGFAGQTQLLALNAAIEASRAGAEGRGFAVLAAEIKDLAEQSRAATVQVRQILAEVRVATDEGLLVTEEGLRAADTAEAVVTRTDRAIAVLSDTVAESAERATRIRTSAEQQAQGVGQIREALHAIDAASRDSMRATQRAEEAARELDSIATRLGELMTEGRPTLAERAVSRSSARRAAPDRLH